MFDKLLAGAHELRSTASEIRVTKEETTHFRCTEKVLFHGWGIERARSKRHGEIKERPMAG